MSTKLTMMRENLQLAIRIMEAYWRQTFPRLERKKKTFFPETVMIQTSSFCNAKCIICPYSEVANELPQGKMSWKLFKKIIDECSQNNISKIALHLMNEPLMDSNFIDYLAYAREKNLHAGIGFSTNASLLNREKGKEIIKYIDVIHISFPSLDEDEYEKITGLNFNVSFSNIDYFLSLTKKSSRKIKVRLIFVKPFNFYKNLRNYVEAERIKNFCNKRNIACLRWLFFNRAGNLSNYKNYFQVVTRRTKLNGCSLPTKHSPLRLMPILFNGDVLLCCMDWRREIVVGNLNTQNIAEIWNSKLYKGILDKIYFGKKSNNNFLCTRCINDCKFSYFFNVSIGCIYLLFRKLFLSIGRMLKYQKS